MVTIDHYAIVPCHSTKNTEKSRYEMSPNAKEWQDAMSIVILEDNQGAIAIAKSPQPLTIQKFEYLLFNCRCFLSNMVRNL